MEPSEIASIVQKIADSGLSVDEYFGKHAVPFGRAQYFRYKARLAAEGLDGLIDGRGRGNHRKLTPDAEGFLRGVHQANPRLSLQQICESLESALGIRVDRSTVSRFLRGAGEQIRVAAACRNRKGFSRSCGGFEIIGALALHLGWAQHTAEVILQERDRFRKTRRIPARAGDARPEGRNALGQIHGRV